MRQSMRSSIRAAATTPSEHPTLVPVYDVEKAAREGASPTPRSTAPPEPYRDDMPTLTDPAELEAARVKSTFAIPPPAVATPVVAADPSAKDTVSPEAERARYEARLGGFTRVPVVAVSAETLAALPLDGRAGMLLPLLDGRSTIQTILDIGILNPGDTLAALADLLDRGIVRLA
jgi:hypothetical protein